MRILGIAMQKVFDTTAPQFRMQSILARSVHANDSFVERVAAGAPCLLRGVARSEAWPLRLTQTNAQRSVLGFLRGTADDDIPIRGVLF